MAALRRAQPQRRAVRAALMTAVAVAVSAALCGAAAGAGAGGADTVLRLSDATFDSALKKHPLLFVRFFAPWCAHSKRMGEAWKDLAASSRRHGATVADVDCTADAPLCSEHGVKGYPTLLLISRGGGAPSEHTGGRTAAALADFVKRQKAARMAGSKPPVETEGGLLKLAADNFDDAVADGFVFVKFFTPWCGHCKRMAGAWMALASAYDSEDGVAIAEVDCTKHKSVCDRAQVRGYPTLIGYIGGEEAARHNGERDLATLSAFVDEWRGADGGGGGGGGGEEEDAYGADAYGDDAYGADADADGDGGGGGGGGGEEGDDGVVTLDEESFDAVAASGVTFVKFYAPWCGHCKQLAPAWADLASEFEDVDSVTVARVDCTQSSDLCDAHDVTGYPTLALFRDGARVDTYRGHRDVGALSAYLRQRAAKRDEL